jgi:hypothetical protein
VQETSFLYFILLASKQTVKAKAAKAPKGKATPTKIPIFAGTPYVPIPLMTGNPAMLPILPIVPPIAPPIVIIPAATGGLVGPQGSVGPAGPQGRIVHILLNSLDNATLLLSSCIHEDLIALQVPRVL